MVTLTAITVVLTAIIAWSVKTVANRWPHVFTGKANEAPKCLRLISGRNNPTHSVGITDLLADPDRTGAAVLRIYNARIEEARGDHDDVRQVVLARNWNAQEFTIFERAITPYEVNDYEWQIHDGDKLWGFKDGEHAFT